MKTLQEGDLGTESGSSSVGDWIGLVSIDDQNVGIRDMKVNVTNQSGKLIGLGFSPLARPSLVLQSHGGGGSSKFLEGNRGSSVAEAMEDKREGRTSMRDEEELGGTTRTG